jgi:ADP-ribosyl-[dinitrogen reductase] hydrolase
MAGYIGDPQGCSSRYHATHPNSSAGNGAVMRCAPVAIFYLHSLDQLVEVSRASARVTHYDPQAQSSCVILNAWIQAAICRGVRDGRAEAKALLNEMERPAWHRLERIDACGEDDIMSSGYTVRTLEAAAWSFLTTESYEEAVIRAANLDADTVAAVCGALAGAYYGYAAVPSKWRGQLQHEAGIREIALRLGSTQM